MMWSNFYKSLINLYKMPAGIMHRIFSKMHYLILTKLENSTRVSLKVKGLRKNENERVSTILTERGVRHDKITHNYLEADIMGVEMLNLLSQEFGYKVVSQSMAMEHTSLGGRDFQIEKVIWTLAIEDIQN